MFFIGATGILKEELGYDLNAAAFDFNTKDLTNKKQVASKLFGIFFNFSTEVQKTVTITLQRVSGTTTYIIQVFKKILTPKSRNYTWYNPIELPEVIDVRIQVSKTSSACSMNLLSVYK